MRRVSEEQLHSFDIVEGFDGVAVRGGSSRWGMSTEDAAALLALDLRDERALNDELVAALKSALLWHQSDAWREASKRQMRDDWAAQRDIIKAALAKAERGTK